jgi:transcriptional regulator with XRE-family HTH domain
MLSIKNSNFDFFNYLCDSMALAENVQIFLMEKFQNQAIDRGHFAKKCNISYNAVTQLLNAKRLNPDISTLLKIAKYFRCTIDEVIGRERNYIVSKNYELKEISLEKALLNLKNFVISKLDKDKIKSDELAQKFGVSTFTIDGLITGKKKSIRTPLIVKLADDSEISIDKIVGRT